MPTAAVVVPLTLGAVQVLSVLLLLLAVALVRKLGKAQVTPAAAGTSAAVAAAAAAAAKQGAKPGAGSGSPPVATAAAAAAVGAAAMGAVVVAGGDGGSSRSWRLLPVQPPPVMWDPSYALPEDAAQQASAVPTDPYTSLKQNYEAVIAFLTLVSVRCGWQAGGLGWRPVTGIRLFKGSEKGGGTCAAVGTPKEHDSRRLARGT